MNLLAVAHSIELSSTPSVPGPRSPRLRVRSQLFWLREEVLGCLNASQEGGGSDLIAVQGSGEGGRQEPRQARARAGLPTILSILLLIVDGMTGVHARSTILKPQPTISAHFTAADTLILASLFQALRRGANLQKYHTRGASVAHDAVADECSNPFATPVVLSLSLSLSTRQALRGDGNTDHHCGEIGPQSLSITRHSSQRLDLRISPLAAKPSLLHRAALYRDR